MKKNVELLPNSLAFHLAEFTKDKRRFENVFKSVSRMILGAGFEKKNVLGRSVYDFNLFRRRGEKHLVGMYSEINSFVSFVKEAAEGGSSKEMAFVLVGEPGNGKTFFVDYICAKYREFLAKKENRRYTFRFVGIEKLKGYGKIDVIESQTYEDPMVLAMNLFPDKDETKEYLSKAFGLSKQLEQIHENFRPLGACSSFIWKDIRNATGGDIDEMLNFIEIIDVPLEESLGTVTGKYPAKDKITSSAVDLLGEESIQRLLHITNSNNPYRFDLRRGALARVAGGGVHFADEIFKNKKDLVQVYLGVIQNRTVEVDGYKWPLDTLVVATSNNSEFDRFVSEKEEAPIVDRCRICYVSHNTDYKLQKELTDYAIGHKKRTTFAEADLHQDPNLNYAASVAVVLSRLLHSEKLTQIEALKLSAGEVAGEKSIKTLKEVIDMANQNPNVVQRWGQKGIGQRNLGRAIQLLFEMPETQEGQCLFAYDIFEGLDRVILDYVVDGNDRQKYQEEIKIAKKLYRERIMTEMFNAYMDDSSAISKDVMNYVNMIIGTDAENLGPDKTWKYKDPQTGELTALKIDVRYINSVEERLGLKTEEQRETFRTSIRKIYGQKISVDSNYNFMDNLELVKAVTDVRLKSDIAGAGSLMGALANRTNEENQKLFDRMIGTMINELGYCKTCAQKTIEYFCTQEDE